jgi:hypothetical protein
MRQHEDRYEKVVRLEPGQVWCDDCCAVVEEEDQVICVECGHAGCVHCMGLSTAEDAEYNDEYVCGPECDAAWREKLGATQKG